MVLALKKWCARCIDAQMISTLKANSLKNLKPSISLMLFVVAAFAVNQHLSEYGWSAVATDLWSSSLEIILEMLLISGVGYFLLGVSEWLAIQITGEKLEFKYILFGAFLSNAISQNAGSSLISGGSIRFRVYRDFGLSNSAIIKITVLGSLSYFLSAFTLLLFSVAASPQSIFLSELLSSGPLKALLIIGACLTLVWLVLCVINHQSLQFRGEKIALPTPAIALQQIASGSLELLFTGLVLFIPLHQFVHISFGEFIIIFLVAQLAGLVSQVPGGIGIFESSFILMLGNNSPPEKILAALILYRFIYYLVPLLIAGILLLLYETKTLKSLSPLRLRYAFQLIHFATPKIFSILLFLIGSILLFSGATPEVHERMEWMHRYVPLPLIDISHVIVSLVGLGMILLSRAVATRLDSAYFATITLLFIGMFSSILKGVDLPVALILGAVLIAFIPTRKHFYRKSALLKLEMPIGHVLIGAAVIGLSTWLGFASYKNIPYSHDLWWQISVDGDVPRFLRSLFALSAALAGLILYRLLRTTRTDLSLPSKLDLELATEMVRNENITDHHLVLTGDKYILWSKTKKSFLMFGVTRQFWIAMGDPVGDKTEFEELVWLFREAADKVLAKIAFYEIGIKHIPIYLNLGLSLIKLGQQAWIPLQSFGLEGKKRQSLRNAINRYQREGYVFEIVAPGQIEAILPQLKNISDAWLREKNAREKRFSLCFFDEEYLKNAQIAVVIKNGEIAAFANILTLNNRHQMAIDLMRYLPGVPNGIMEFLSISLILWAKQEGFIYFNLGIAPLSGLEDHALAPIWHKIGRTFFRVGGGFYNFTGVYGYKEKFDPEWKPIYLAAPPGLQTASALLAVTTLISGGVKGLFSKF